MPKRTALRPSDILAPAQLANIAAQRPLRPGEHQALLEHLADLDMKLHAARESNDRYRTAHEEAITSQALRVTLEGNALILAFPEQHHITLQLGETPSQRAIAFEALLRILKERRSASRKSIGTAAAPVQYDIHSILRSIRQDQVSRVPAKQKSSCPPDITLEDLDIEL